MTEFFSIIWAVAPPMALLLGIAIAVAMLRPNPDKAKAKAGIQNIPGKQCAAPRMVPKQKVSSWAPFLFRH